MTLILFIFGASLLIAGAELLVRGASRIAVSAGISPLVVGLTVVAFGTSAPELAVTLGASISGQADVALGNVVGSNIANVLLVLGLSAVVAPLVVSVQLVRLDVPLMIGASILVYLFAFDGGIGRGEGGVLFAVVVLYTAFLAWQSRRETLAAREVELPLAGIEPGLAERPRWAWNVVLVAVGLGLLVVGARWLVQGAVAAAVAMGVSKLVIGLTVVALGTSLPELATSVLASLKGERDIAVGNLVGSNLFNLLAVLGLGATLSPEGIPVAAAALGFDLPVMIAVAVACLPIFFTGYAIARWEGGLFLGYYAAYTLYLILAASRHDALPLYSNTMALFVLPLTAVTLAVLGARAWRQGRRTTS